MEELTKSQIVLLTLLVSFMTSIATGIVTVSLMEQAPPVVAQTVNRVIERTIETVAPASQAAASAVTRERTVVVKETELISQAVAAISPSLVRIYTSSSTSATFLGFGIVLSADGMIVTDASAIKDLNAVSLALSDGTRVQANAAESGKAGLAFLQATSTDSSISMKPALISGGAPILGQTVVVLTGRSVARVEDGIITALLQVDEKDAAAGLIIDSSISSDSIGMGSPLINTDGEIIGVSTGVSRASSSKGFIAASALILSNEEKMADSATR